MDTARLLNDVHTIMDQIRLFTHQIWLHSSSAADIVTHGTKFEVTGRFRAKLNTLKYLTDKSCWLSCQAEERIEYWIAMVCELVEICIQSKSLSEEKKKEAVVAYESAKEMIESTDAKKRKVIEMMTTFEK